MTPIHPYIVANTSRSNDTIDTLSRSKDTSIDDIPITVTDSFSTHNDNEPAQTDSTVTESHSISSKPKVKQYTPPTKFFDRLREFYSARRLRKVGFATNSNIPTVNSSLNIEEREKLYTEQERAFNISVDAIQANGQYLPCLQLGCTSFFSGVVFAGFFAGPLGAAYHALLAPPKLISVQHVFKAASLSSIRWGIRYGTFLGIFRMLSYSIDRIVEERSPETLGLSAGIAGATAAFCPKFPSEVSNPKFGLNSIRYIHNLPVSISAIIATVCCSSSVYFAAKLLVESEDSSSLRRQITM